jgi:predicted phosphodiesterase
MTRARPKWPGQLAGATGQGLAQVKPVMRGTSKKPRRKPRRAPPRRTGGQRVTWLHLSDWHQRGDTFDRQVVRDALMKDIRSRAAISPALAAVDFIVFSGDIAFSGRAEEYTAAAKRLFGPLFTALGFGQTGWRRLFVVPGNHDLDWTELERVPEGILREVETREGVDRVLGARERRRELMRPFAAYAAFTSARMRTGSRGLYAHTRNVRLGGRVVALVGLNSAWLAARHRDAAGHPDDYGRLAVGERQVYDALSGVANADLRVAVMHHPPGWLREADRCRVVERLLRDCDIVLHGHEHMPGVNVVQSERGDVVIIPAGASYNRRTSEDPRYTNAYNFVTVDFEAGEGTVYLRRWNDVSGVWQADVDASTSGEYRFALPSHKPQTVDQMNALRALVARDRSALGRRFFDEVDVEMKQRLETVGPIELVRHEMKYTIRVAPGELEELVYTASANPRATRAIESNGLKIEPQTVRVKMDGRVQEPQEISPGRVVYRLELQGHAVKLEYKRTLYAMPEDVWRLLLPRFTRRFRLRFQRDRRLEYDFAPSGGLPATRPRRKGPIDLEETECESLCCPRQGYLIHWWPGAA